MVASIQYIYSYFSFQQRGLLQFDNLMSFFIGYIEFYWFFWYSYVVIFVFEWYKSYFYDLIDCEFTKSYGIVYTNYFGCAIVF